MGNSQTICRDYNKGICRCNSCKSHERELGIHRSSDDFINHGSLVKFRNSTEWFVNNNEEKCEVRFLSDPKFMWTIVDNSMRNGWILTLKNNDNDDVNMNQRFYLDNS